MNKNKCLGCHNDFYNGKNDLGIKQCWSFKTAKIVKRFRLHVDTPMNQRSGYKAVKVPNCYSMPRYIHVEKIPDYAR